MPIRAGDVAIASNAVVVGQRRVRALPIAAVAAIVHIICRRKDAGVGGDVRDLVRFGAIRVVIETEPRPEIGGRRARSHAHTKCVLRGRIHRNALRVHPESGRRPVSDFHVVAALRIAIHRRARTRLPSVNSGSSLIDIRSARSAPR